MPSLLDTFVLPPRLLVRALDDLHELALASRQVLDMGARILELGERIDARADAVLALGERIDARADAMLALGERIDARAGAILELGGSIDGRAGRIVEMGGSMEDLGREILRSGDELQARAKEVADRGAEVAAALPVLERAVQLGEPLEGAVERLGRIVDRLPGGAAARRRGPGAGSGDPL